MNFLVTLNKYEEKEFTSLRTEYELDYKKEGPYSILVEKGVRFFKNSNFISITDGYFRDLTIASSSNQDHFQECLPAILKEWPLKNDITGSFSNVLIEQNSWEITISNDVIGPYPLYYLCTEGNFFISNSIIWIGAVSGCETDEIGVAERALGPELSTIGSRTIIKDCKRILPGEWIKFNCSGKILRKKYDNILFQNVTAGKNKKELVQEYWSLLQKEIRYCLNNDSQVNIALSGGVDSRIILGSLPQEKKIKCHTYGAAAFYETTIARTLAKIREAEFKNYYSPYLHFPSFQQARNYTLKTEALYLGSWLEILEAQNPEQREPFFIGDLTESLQGRNIKFHSSRIDRKKNFFKTTILKKSFSFQPSTKMNFYEWKEGIKTFYLLKFRQENLDKLELKLTHEIILEEVSADLEELFSRIENHKIPFMELYDELFSWFTHARMPMA
jgi:hypothetical protein